MTAGTGGMRIAFLSPCYWPEVQRGTERVVHDLAGALVARGERVRLITSHPGLPSRRSEEGVSVTRHWRPPDSALLRRGFQEYLSHLPFTYMSLVRGDDDLVQAFYPTDAVAAVRWAKRTGRPVVFHYGGIPQRAVLSSRRLRLRIAQEALTGADAVVVHSEAAARGMRRWFGIEPRVINPGVRMRDFELEPRRAELPTIACAAAIEDGRKRVSLLLAAFALVRRERPDARLLLPRPGNREFAERVLSANPGVELFEPDPRAVAEVFREAWVSALAAYNEAFGLVVVESLACGTPVVATRDGAPPEILNSPDIGRLFDGDEHNLARALLEGLELGVAAGSAEACRRRAADFSAESCAAGHLELYRELVTRGRRAPRAARA